MSARVKKDSRDAVPVTVLDQSIVGLQQQIKQR